jgi:hypothetical protein
LPLGGDIDVRSLTASVGSAAVSPRKAPTDLSTWRTP